MCSGTYILALESIGSCVRASNSALMRVLRYRDLVTKGHAKAIDRACEALARGDWRGAELKKLTPGPYYRAALGYAARLLVRFVTWHDETVCLVLELIPDHEYDRSRFLRGAHIDLAKIDDAPVTTEPVADGGVLRGARAEGSAARGSEHGAAHGPGRVTFDLLDKPLVFDEPQLDAYAASLPLILIGAAGSGKTAVTLCRIREMPGTVLYVTLSPYLARSAQALYSAHDYSSDAQSVDFFSLDQLVDTILAPSGKSVTFALFQTWFERNREAGRQTQLSAHQLYEEFRGVLAAQVSGRMQLAAYLMLGVRQSLVPPSLREAAYTWFGKYNEWLATSNLYDPSESAAAVRAQAMATYDFVVVDEVQDISPAQLALVLATLKHPTNFLLCGDSHQIVHPNFFSWAAVKTMFWRGAAGDLDGHELRILAANFRNTTLITQLANRILLLKQARFGSVDRESTFLVHAVSTEPGAVSLVKSSTTELKALDEASRLSVDYAVIVLRDDDKASAKAHFRTPLIFAVHEAKGLEYKHVILFEVIASARREFAEVCEGVSGADLTATDVAYRRAKDRGDKSLEHFKFYVNSLYVGVTRATQTIAIVEADLEHPLLQLLELQAGTMHALAANPQSSKDAWAAQAKALEEQGKHEQAQAIREQVLGEKPVPWPIWNDAVMDDVRAKAFDPKGVSAKARQTLFDYAIWHGFDGELLQLASLGFGPAATLRIGAGFLDDFDKDKLQREWNRVRGKILAAFDSKNSKEVLSNVEMYGANYRAIDGATALMHAAGLGNIELCEQLVARGATLECRDAFGHTAWSYALRYIVENHDGSGRSPRSSSATVVGLYRLLAPMTLDVRASGRLIRLNRSQGEYWILSTMMAHTLVNRRASMPFVNSDVLLACMAALSIFCWPAQRHTKTYINGVLSRAEMYSAYLPQRKLFYRIARGQYSISPFVEVQVGDEWQNFFDVSKAQQVHEYRGGVMFSQMLHLRRMRDAGPTPMLDPTPTEMAER